jgi:hypothetical protein
VLGTTLRPTIPVVSFTARATRSAASPPRRSGSAGGTSRRLLLRRRGWRLSDKSVVGYARLIDWPRLLCSHRRSLTCGLGPTRPRRPVDCRGFAPSRLGSDSGLSIRFAWSSGPSILTSYSPFPL